MITYYAPPELIRNGRIYLTNQEFHHAIHVTRSKRGDRLRVVDGLGNVYFATLEEIQDNIAVLEIEEKTTSEADPQTHVAIMQGVIKGERMDYFVEKATEVGVSEVIPVITAKSYRPGPGKVERWRKVAISAMKQSGRAKLPHIHEPVEFEKIPGFLENYDTLLMLEPRAQKSLKNQELTNKILLLVGPESGFEEDEVNMAKSWGFETVKLGKRILRAETAGVVALGITLHLKDDL